MRRGGGARAGPGRRAHAGPRHTGRGVAGEPQRDGRQDHPYRAQRRQHQGTHRIHQTGNARRRGQTADGVGAGELRRRLRPLPDAWGPGQDDRVVRPSPQQAGRRADDQGRHRVPRVHGHLGVRGVRPGATGQGAGDARTAIHPCRRSRPRGVLRAEPVFVRHSGDHRPVHTAGRVRDVSGLAPRRADRAAYRGRRTNRATRPAGSRRSRATPTGAVCWPTRTTAMFDLPRQ